MRTLYGRISALLGMLIFLEAPVISHAGGIAPQEGEDGAKSHSGWLDTQAIRQLLTGNTITATNSSRSYRWWIHYHDAQVISWLSDRGREEFGIWYVLEEGTYCSIWKSGTTKCRKIRHSGKVVRFHDVESGKPESAAVLEPGDRKNRKAALTPEAREALVADLVSQLPSAACTRLATPI